MSGFLLFLIYIFYGKSDQVRRRYIYPFFYELTCWILSFARLENGYGTFNTFTSIYELSRQNISLIKYRLMASEKKNKKSMSCINRKLI